MDAVEDRGSRTHSGRTQRGSGPAEKQSRGRDYSRGRTTARGFRQIFVPRTFDPVALLERQISSLSSASRPGVVVAGAPPASAVTLSGRSGRIGRGGDGGGGEDQRAAPARRSERAVGA